MEYIFDNETDEIEYVLIHCSGNHPINSPQTCQKKDRFMFVEDEFDYKDGWALLEIRWRIEVVKSGFYRIIFYSKVGTNNWILIVGGYNGSEEGWLHLKYAIGKYALK